jgi:hypothetical protein
LSVPIRSGETLWRQSAHRVAARAALLFLLLGAAGAAGAQSQAPVPGAAAAPPGALQSPPTTVDSLTVIGKRSKQSPYARALNFVQSHGAPAKVTGQLARWTDPICPVVMGLSPAMNAFVAARVEAVAADVGAPKAKRGKCKENIEILFTNDPQAMVSLVARKESALLGLHDASQGAALTTFKPPIQAWYLTGTENDDGLRSVDAVRGVTGSETTAVGTGGGNLSAMRMMAQTPEGCAGSQFTRCLSSLFVNVLVVADGNALDGRPTGPLADYIALLALSQSRTLEGCDGLPSILDLLSTSCGDRPEPDGLTDSDVGYLKGLYRTNLETVMSTQKNGIAGQMLKDAD